MKIMVIDRDRDAVEEIEKICADIPGLDLVIEPIKNNAIEMARAETYDAIFFDPAPQNEVRSFIIGARRGISHYNPIIAMSHQLDSDVKKLGAKQTLQNMRTLNDLITRLSDDSYDSTSKEGVISRSAFYQIFISCLDRADRYGEESFLTFATVSNIDDIRAKHGDAAASEICSNLKKYTMRIRRLSDIAGQTAPEEICLMLMRPANAEEPLMAIKRFSESMEEYIELIGTSDIKPIVTVKMIELPSGATTFEHDYS
jgi:hypothetical protein